MKDVAEKMDFDVISDLHDKNSRKYNIKIELEKEVDSTTRELAITVSGATVRNYYKKMNGAVNDTELADLIKEKLHSSAWMPNEEFKVKSVNLSLIHKKARA